MVNEKKKKITNKILPLVSDSFFIVSLRYCSNDSGSSVCFRKEINFPFFNLRTLSPDFEATIGLFSVSDSKELELDVDDDDVVEVSDDSDSDHIAR